MHCLVYNTTGEPLELVPSLMGFVLHLKGKAVILETLPGRVASRHRRELGARERLTRDHLLPRSKGGTDEWLNVVTACSSCNHRKDDRLLKDVGRSTRVTPWVPSRGDLAIRRFARQVSAVA